MSNFHGYRYLNTRPHEIAFWTDLSRKNVFGGKMITFFYKGERERERDSEFMLRFGCKLPIRAFFMSIVFFHKKRGKIKRFRCLLGVASAINSENTGGSGFWGGKVKEKGALRVLWGDFCGKIL